MIIFNSELKMMSHRVMKHSINLNRGKNDQLNTHLTATKLFLYAWHNHEKAHNYRITE